MRPRIAPVRLIFGLICAVALPAIAWSQAAPESGPKTVRLLTVGNSFSQDATRHLAPLTKSLGDVLVHHACVLGGATLQQHVDKFEAHEADAADPAGLYAASKRALADELADGPWDVVTIQQASIKSHDLATYRPYARQLFDTLRAGAPDARILVHETWAYRRDDPRFAVAKPKPGEPADQGAMYRGLAAAYRTIAEELGTTLIPVGDAFHRADNDPNWGYRPAPQFDRSALVAPALPPQVHSLHVGWKWVEKDGETSLTMDGHHASTAGQYLGACVFYEVLFGKDVRGATYRPAGLDAEYARFLRETAHRAVAEAATRVPAASAR